MILSVSVVIRYHQVTHYENLKVSCEVCAKKFSSDRNLQQHMQLHTEETPYCCEICGRSFKVNTNASTKRIQPARGWCATVKRDCKLYPPYPASPEAWAPFFLGNQSSDPASWLVERHLLSGNIESKTNIKNPFTHTHLVPHTQVIH